MARKSRRTRLKPREVFYHSEKTHKVADISDSWTARLLKDLKRPK